MRQRDIHIDALKALATILVIIGHAVQFTDSDFDNNWIFKIIYSFHMPLFMCIAGYLYTKKANLAKEIFNKAKVLLIPFYVWGIISYVYFTDGSITLTALIDTLKEITFNPGLGLWFLWALFICFVVFYILPEKGKEFYVFAFIILLNKLQIEIPSTAYFGMNLVSWQIPFFLAGFVIRKYDLKYLFRNKYLFLAALIIYLLSTSQWHRLSITQLFGTPINVSIQYDTLNYIRYTAAISAFIVLFGMNFSIKNEIAINTLTFLSKNSLSYYAMQILVLSVLIGKLHVYFHNDYIIEAIAVLMTISMVTIGIYFVNRINLARIILFGR